MDLLAFETSGDIGSVALASAGRIEERRIEEVRAQGARLLACVDEMLAAQALSLDALDALVFGQGPGSFTGLRLAAATAQGLAMARRLPLIPVSSLAALAQQAWRCAGAEHVLVCVDARMGEVYWGTFRVAAGLAEPLTEARLTAPAGVTPAPAGALGIGSGFLRYAAELRDCLPDPAQCWPEASPAAIDLLPFAERALRQGAGRLAAPVGPVYLRGESAWRRNGR